MLPFGVTIPATVPQRSEIPEGLMNYPVLINTYVSLFLSIIPIKLINLISRLNIFIAYVKKIIHNSTRLKQNSSANATCKSNLFFSTACHPVTWRLQPSSGVWCPHNFRINARCNYTRHILGMTFGIIKPALLLPDCWSKWRTILNTCGPEPVGHVIRSLSLLRSCISRLYIITHLS
jgi:hypothetical protein